MSINDSKIRQIKDIGKVITGRTPPTEITTYFGDEYPFITPTDMIGEKSIGKTERRLSASGANLLSHNLLPPKSILVSCIGWQMGKVALTIHPSFTNQQINAIIPNANVDVNFIYYSLCTRRKELQNLASVGTRTPILNKSNFENFEIVIPPISIQHKIADILSAYDDLIENNTRRIAILEEMARMLYQEWFVKFHFPGHEQVKMVESALGLIPEGWEVAKLGDIAQEIRRSINPENIDPKTPYLGLEHLPRKSIALSDWGNASEVQSTKLIFKKGEILFGKIRPYFHKVGVAPLDGVCSSDTIVILPKVEYYHALVLLCVSSREFVEYASLTSQGTKMPRANWDVLINYPLVMPPLPITKYFNEIISDVIRDIYNLIFKNRNLRRTRDLLLPKLISGEIDVSSWVEEGDGEEIEPEPVPVSAGRVQQGERRNEPDVEQVRPIDVKNLVRHSLWKE